MGKKGGNKPKREKLPRSAVIINIVMSVIILAICAVFFLIAYGKMKNGL